MGNRVRCQQKENKQYVPLCDLTRVMLPKPVVNVWKVRDMPHTMLHVHVVKNADKRQEKYMILYDVTVICCEGVIRVKGDGCWLYCLDVGLELGWR